VAWLFTLDTSLTHDEVVYVNVAEQPFTSDYYPGDTFLRHPPLGITLLSAWQGLGLLLRAWPVVWTLGGLGFLTYAVEAREGSPWWLLAPVLASPALVPLLTITLYPPMFCFLSIAAWGWATRRRWAEIVAWNLAIFTHELALLLLAVVLLPRAVQRVRNRETSLRSWLRLVWPYPAAIAWGLVMCWALLVGSDPRGGWVFSAVVDPSPNLAAVMQLKPFVSLVLAIALVPLLVGPRRDPRASSRGFTLATTIAILATPFYRYAVTLVPGLVALRAADPPGWFTERGPALLVAALVASSGLGIGATVTGADTVNAAALPGLIDHDEAQRLVEPGEQVLVRSPLSFAHVLRANGYELTGTAPTGPAHVNLTRDGQTLTLYRAETVARAQQIQGLDAVVVPSTWRNVPEDLPGEGWRATDRADRMERFEPG